jgi:hypothetical protein
MITKSICSKKKYKEYIFILTIEINALKYEEKAERESGEIVFWWRGNFERHCILRGRKKNSPTLKFPR